MPSECEGCGSTPHVLVRLTNGSLRLCQQCLGDFNGKNPDLAAALARIDALEAALRPFAAVAQDIDRYDGGVRGDHFPAPAGYVTMGHCRQAAQILKEAKP